MLDYASLSAIAAVVREGSFERAAAALGVTPSAVSQRVKGLEERLGAVLIMRGQPCTATEAGARICAHVEKVRLLEGEMTQALPGLSTQSERAAVTLRVAVNADSIGTWFLTAAARFAEATGTFLDLVLDDEAHTAERLRTGEVLAAVTAERRPVQGCRTLSLGSLRYLATCSPDFLARHLPEGVTPERLNRTPTLRFDRKDSMQKRWAVQALGVEIDPPVHWVPATHGFVDASLAGLGWGMNPLSLIQDHLSAGRLVELVPGQPFDVPLYWQHTRLGASLMDRLTREVVAAGKTALRQKRSPPPPATGFSLIAAEPLSFSSYRPS